MATPLPGTPPATPAFNTTATTPPFPPVPPSPPQFPLVNGTAPIPANGVPTVEPPPRGNNRTLVALGVGVGLGGLIVLIGVGVFVLFYKRRKRKRENLPLSSKHEYSAGPPQHMQNNAPPPPHNTIYQQPKPTGTVPNAHSPQRPASTSPVESGSLGSDNIPLPRHPGTHLSFPNSTFTYEELAMATDNFSSANLLGQGGFGYVHRGVLPNGKEVAIKQLKTGSVQGEREFQAEVDTISRVHHRHLVSLVGYSISGDRRMLVYEFISNKTLEFHLHGEGRPPMNWATRLKIALGAAKGLAYLHEDCHPKVIHRDIKAANILLDNDFEAKVADFGLAKFSPDTDTHVSTRVMGTFGYLAPEYAASGKLTEKSDVFSFGVVLLELITGRRPIDKARPFMDDGMVEWARPLLLRAIESRNFDGLVDPRLDDYEPTEMAQMVACAAVSVRNSARRRPQMSQIVRALEGNLSIDELCKEIPPGHSSMYGSSDYDSSNQYKEELNKFRKLALESQEQSTSEYSAFTTDQGAHPSTSSTENQHDTQEIDTENLIKNGVGARVIPVE